MTVLLAALQCMPSGTAIVQAQMTPDPAVVDIAVYYTTAARDQAGGTDMIKAEIDTMIAETNQAFMDGGISLSASLVHVAEASETVTQTGSDRARLIDPSDGFMDEVHYDRNQMAADVVVAIHVGGGGIACLRESVSADTDDCAFAVSALEGGGVTFAHELGHLMGLWHDRYEVHKRRAGNPPTPIYAYAHGYVNQRAFDDGAAEAARWQTIMAYNQECVEVGGFFCTELLRFSSPNQIYPDPGGHVMGVPGEEHSSDYDGPADAVHTLNQTGSIVAGYRNAPATTLTFDAAQYTANEGGTAATVTVQLSVAPTREVVIPIVTALATGASVHDYEAPEHVTFSASDTAKTFSVKAVDDGADDDGETVTLTFGDVLPRGVSEGTPVAATVTLANNDTATGTPGIARIELTSHTATAYGLDDEIEVTVWFDRHVEVTGQPQIGLTVGARTRQAEFQSAFGEVLTFVYSFEDNESDDNGVSIAADSLTLNGGAIRDGAMENADLTHDALSDDEDHRVDAVKPSFQGAEVIFDTLTLTYGEPLDANSTPLPADFTVTVAGIDRSVDHVTVSQSSVTLRLASPVSMGEAVTVSYASSQPASPIRDLSGNEAVDLASTTATNETLAAVYDTDADGLIEISTLAQLDAIRYDLNGSGDPDATGATAYRAAFPDAYPDANARLTCSGHCLGYELEADLDFDTNGNGRADSGDTYWNSGQGWEPIGKFTDSFGAVFEGSGHTIRNLFIDRPLHPIPDGVGLFSLVKRRFGGLVDRESEIRRLRLMQVDVTGNSGVGGLAGTAGFFTVIKSIQVAGSVSGGGSVGGLVGENYNATITGCYATASVSGTDAIGGLVGTNRSIVTASYATGSVSGTSKVGGLVGENHLSVDSSYATGRVSGTSKVGGLVGHNEREVEASYATGRVSGDTDIGGLVGNSEGAFAAITDSYWDTDTSGITTGSSGDGQTTTNLQAPTSYSGIYVNWDDVDDPPWHFGTSTQYPAIEADFEASGTATWSEFGYQIRAGPTLTTTSDSSRSLLSWTAVDLNAWNPAPAVTYSVLRDDGAESESVASGLAGLTFSDADVTVGSAYTYQVAAHVGGGIASRSVMEDVTVVAADSSPPSIESIESDATHPTNAAFTVTITFSESVMDLMANEITVTNGTGSNFSGSGASYRLRVTPTADFEGNVTVTVPAGAAKDGTDNTSEAGSETFEVDTRAPAFVTNGAATVNGATLELVFDENLAAAYRLSSSISVTGGTTRTITNAAIVGTAVVLTISPPILHGETDIEVDYSAPSQNALTDRVGNKISSFEDRAVSNQTPASTVSSEVSLSLDTDSLAEGNSAKTVTVTGTLNRAARPAATDVTIEVGTVGDTATEGTDYTAVDDLALTIPAYATSDTVNFTLTPANDRIDEPDESLTVRGSTTANGLSVAPSGGLSIGLADNDAAPSLALTVDKSSFGEDGGTATVTVGTGSGSTFETAQTVNLSVAGTATETTDYTIGGKTLTLPAGMGTSASMVSATLTGVDDDVDDDGETVVVWGTRNGLAFGQRRTLTIEDNDDPEVTVSFAQSSYRAVEGGNVEVTVTLNAVPERSVSIPVEAQGADGADSADFSISPSSLSFGANETTKTVRVSASNDSVVDPGERVRLRFGSPLPDRVSEGSIPQASVAIRDTDFTFAPAFAAGSGTTETATGIYTVSETESAARLSLALETPNGVSVDDILEAVVVTLATRENAGTQGTDEDYATQRRIGTFGDYGALSQDISFATTDFTDDATCGCALAAKAVSVDLFDDRIHEPAEVFGLRVSRKTGRLSVASRDITVKVEEDDAEPVLTLDTNPAAINEAGGASTVTVSTGSGSTFPTAQTIDLDISGTATENTDFEIDAKRLTLPAGSGTDASSIETTVRALDDAIDDDAETIILSATRGGTAFENRTLTITDDETGSTQVDLSVNPAQVREDVSSATVRVTASLNAGTRAQDTDVSLTVGSVGDSADEGTDYQTIGTLTLTIDAGETEADTKFTLRPINDGSAEGAEQITVDGSVSGLAVNSATLTLNDDDVESTDVALTVDPDEVGEAAGSRAVRVTGTLNGGARTSNTLVTVIVGSSSDTATEGTDYADVGELELSIPANRTDGSVTFTLRPTNDATAEGDETISMSGDVAGLTVTPAELVLEDNDAVSTRLSLSLRPSSVSEGAPPTDVTVTGTLNAGARETETLVTLTVGAPTDSAVSNTDYAAVPNETLTIPANETRAETTFTLAPDDDMIAEGAESITVGGSASGLTVEAASLTLSDNDTASRVIMLAADPPSVREDIPEQVTVTAGLDAATRVEDTTMRLTVGAPGDTAVPGMDYLRLDDLGLTILAGETAAAATFLLDPVNNETADGLRALRVTGATAAVDLRIEPASGTRVELEDDDVPAILVMPDELTVTEAESSDYRVTLQTAPTADVTVRIGGVAGDLSLDKTSLVFTQADWRIPQDVTVTAADDDDNVQDADVSLTHRASGAPEYAGLGADLVVTVRENDPSLVFSGTSVTVPEGETAEYTVALATEPSGNVMVSISGVSGDLTVFPTDLEFTQGAWDTPQAVTVEAAEDDDASTDPAVTLTHRASNGGYDNIVGDVRVSVTENDGAGSGGGGGGGGGGGAANIPPVVEREIPDQTLDAGEVLEVDIHLNFYDRNQRALDYSVTVSDPSVATVTVNRQGVLTIEGLGRGVTAVTATAADRRDERASDTFVVTVLGPMLVALVPRAADPMRQGFVRVINHDDAGEVSIEAIDDTGVRHGPVTLFLDAGETQHFNSADLEEGNAAKGLPEGVGPGERDWRLVLDSELDIEVLAYIRTEDGVLTAMHDTVPVRDGTYEVAIFNPGSNADQVSRLRLINPGDAPAEVTVTGTDDAGASPGTSIELEIPAGESLTLSASDLETGAGVGGALGDGKGKWRLEVASSEAIVAMSLLSSPTGHLTNLSTIPPMPDDADAKHVVPLFPSASDPLGRQGFVRVVNRSAEDATVTIEAYDDSDMIHDPVMLSIGAGETVHFNSNDLELGNAAKGLSGSTGAGMGDWRLVLSSEAIDVLAYIRTTDGFLTSMHDVAPTLEGAHRVVIFNPGSNPNQVSGLRLVNPGSEDAEVTITGIDDTGASPGSAVMLTVPAGASRTLPAAVLESGGDGLTGALADGAGKWRMRVESEAPIFVMSLLESPTGHLTNLSTAP